ncbi:MAG: hypothetical protein K8U57_19195 [Planctomycetes bacterium]|nr:hypothetical protein [Planctomycetota bacterium]
MAKKSNSVKSRAIAVVVVGLLVIGITIWKTYPRPSKRLLIDPSSAKFMHCPECMTESRCVPNSLDKECIHCGSEKGQVPTAESIKGSQTKSAYGKLVAFVLPEMVFLIAAFYYMVRPAAETGEEKFRYTRCPNCSQKLRYREAQIDNVGACSKCKRAFRFPEGVPFEIILDGGDPNAKPIEDEEDEE